MCRLLASRKAFGGAASFVEAFRSDSLDAVDSGRREAMRRSSWRTRPSAGRMWGLAAGGLSISVICGTMIASYAVGHIDPIAHASERLASPPKDRSLAHLNPNASTFDDVPRSTWGGPLYANEHTDWSAIGSAQDSPSDMDGLTAKWREEDRARDAQIVSSAVFPNEDPAPLVDAQASPDILAESVSSPTVGTLDAPMSAPAPAEMMQQSNTQD